MKNEIMLHAIGKIDDGLIYDAINDTKVKKHTMPRWAKWSAMAACLCLAVCLGGFVTLAMTDSLPSSDKSDIPVEEYIYANKGTYSETDEFDVAGTFEIKDSTTEKSNFDISEKCTLPKGKSKTWTLDISGGSSGTAQDTVTISVANSGAEEYLYICEDVTEKRELANFSSNEDINRVLSNLNPEHRYEITIINLSVSELCLDVSIESYLSANGNILH